MPCIFAKDISSPEVLRSMEIVFALWFDTVIVSCQESHRHIECFMKAYELLSHKTYNIIPYFTELEEFQECYVDMGPEACQNEIAVRNYLSLSNML